MSSFRLPARTAVIRADRLSEDVANYKTCPGRKIKGFFLSNLLEYALDLQWLGYSVAIKRTGVPGQGKVQCIKGQCHGRETGFHNCTKR